jgi:hypothetical protein
VLLRTNHQAVKGGRQGRTYQRLIVGVLNCNSKIKPHNKPNNNPNDKPKYPVDLGLALSGNLRGYSKRSSCCLRGGIVRRASRMHFSFTSGQSTCAWSQHSCKHAAPLQADTCARCTGSSVWLTPNVSRVGVWNIARVLVVRVSVFVMWHVWFLLMTTSSVFITKCELRLHCFDRNPFVL